MAGQWVINATSVDPGWLAVPAKNEREPGWIEQCTSALQRQWGEEWLPEHADVVPVLLSAGLESRRDDDLLLFQLWPTNAPVCFFVHVMLGTVSPDQRPSQGDGVVVETSGLGPGMLVPTVDENEEGALAGFDVYFAVGEVTVIVSVEPTVIDALGLIAPSIHAFIDSLELVDPDGQIRRADAPRVLEAVPVNTWVDTLEGP